MKKIAVLALDGVVPFDLSIPCGVFGFARQKNGEAAYEVRVCGPKKTIRADLFDIQVQYGLETILQCSTLIVPGLMDVEKKIPSPVLEVIRKAVKKEIRVASICSGSFILAQAGVLDHLEVTTHWIGAELMQKQFPLLKVNPDVLYVDQGKILTSAGAAAGMDLCLHLIRKDYGAKVAADTARMSVMPLERHGGQAQFIKHPVPETVESLAHVVVWLEKNSHRPLTLEDIAEKARMSSRTLIRRFKEQMGTSPLQWLIHLRIQKGQALLESTHLSVDEIANKIGFRLGSSFRTHFHKHVGVYPQIYRSNFVVRVGETRNSP